MGLTIKNVSKRFGHRPVLHDISLSVEPGEIVCLLGPSGAGKTTLIRLVSGALRADRGSIEIGGKAMPCRAVLSGLGLMPQNDALYNDLTGLDNLLFFGGLYGLGGKPLKERALELLRWMDLAEDKGKLVANYSGGMKKRLSLAAALLHKPGLLLLDEPTVGIDPVLRKTIWEQFRELSGQGVTVLVSTHVMDEAEKCDRAALLYDGRLIACDTVAALKERTPGKALEDLFFLAREEAL